MRRLARRATFAAADPAPIRWALSGLMALTGPTAGPPRPLGFDLMAAVDALIAEIETGAARLGRPMTVDPRLLTERAALTGLTRQGRTSCGGAARLIEARDGWLAVNLPRESDRLSVPAWLGGGLDEDPWIAVTRGVRGRFLDDLVADGRGLDLAVAAVGRGNKSREPVRLRRMAKGGGRRTPAAPLVVDLSALWAGPLCGQLLAAAGARVIKVESISRPDPVRQAAPGFFDRLQAGKASVALDFRDAGDLVRLRALLHRADVVITSARPRALAQLGLEPEAIFAGNPDLVWVAITAQGWTGENSNAVGFGDDVAAGAGLVAFDGANRPLFAGDALADPLTGLAAAGGALRAMGQGGGVLVDASLSGAAGFAASFAGAPDPGLVFGGEDGWQVACDGREADVAEPRARPWRGAAAAFGADTDEVLERLR